MPSRNASEAKTSAYVGQLFYCRDDILCRGGFGLVFKGKLVLSEGNEDLLMRASGVF